MEYAVRGPILDAVDRVEKKLREVTRLLANVIFVATTVHTCMFFACSTVARSRLTPVY